MRRAALLSALLHVAVFLIAWFGVPDFFRSPPPEEKPLIVEMLPLAQITNAPPPTPAPPKVAEAPKPPEPKPEPPKPEPPKVAEAPKPEPPKPEPPKPPPPPPLPPPPPQAAAPSPPAPAPTPAPRAEAPLPKPPPPRPAPPKPQQVARATPPAPQPNRQQTFDLDNVLRDLTRRRPQAAEPQPAPQQQQAQTAARSSSNAPHNPLLRLSMTEEDAIRQKIYQNWNVDIGAKGIESFVVELRIYTAVDGSVRDVRVESQDWTSDERYRAFVESARRAVFRSSPLPIPADKAAQLTDGNLVLRFSAKDMLGIRG